MNTNQTARILVTYASTAGSTAEVAERIGHDLGSSATVDVVPASARPDPTGYDAVIVGSAIHGGKLMPDVIKFVEKNRSTLNHIPTAYFIVCLTMQNDSPETRTKSRSFLDPICELATPSTVGLFAGRLESARTPFIMRVMMKAMKAPNGDFRDWNAIAAWTRDLPASLGIPVRGVEGLRAAGAHANLTA